MRRPWPLLRITAGLVAGGVLSCMQTIPDEDECEAVCAIARRCGLLPSALGGSPDHNQKANEDDCIARCRASDAGARQVKGLIGVLASPELDALDTLCRPNGARACEELIEELDSNPTTSELSVTATLTVRMTSAVSHATHFSAESWCCFDYDYDIYENPEDANGDGTNEVEAVHDMFQPTHDCVDALIAHFESAEEAIEGLMPDEPLPPGVCDPPAVWIVPEHPDPRRDCYFAYLSQHFEQLDIAGTRTECSIDRIRNLASDLRATRRDWGLEPGGILFDDGGKVRTAAEIQVALEEEIREEINRPMGFLENACEELREELGEDACATIERGGLLDPDDCSGGPVCSEADCISESSDCNRALCDTNISPPSRDCGFFGVTSIRLGFRTNSGAEIFGDPITDCTARPEVTSTFEGVKIGRITPVAVVSGDLGPTITPEGDTVADGSFSWYIEGNPRWVSAGRTELELASPLLEFLEYQYENPLEFLNWMPRRLPIGQACDNQPDLCETHFNDNCDDGIDNDGDGVGDGASPWCNRLLGELVDRCVVSEPGRSLPPNCVYDPGDPFMELPDPEDLPDPDTDGLPDTDFPDLDTGTTGGMGMTGGSDPTETSGPMGTG